MSSRKILLVGGGGYIGQALELYLNNDFEIFSTCRSAGDHTPNHYYLDMNKKASISKVFSSQQFNIIVILASEISGLKKYDGNLLDNLFQSNVFGLNNLLQLITKTQSRAHLIYVSSMTVYDEHATPPVVEQARLLPFHNYGLSKLLAEQIFSFHIVITKSKGAIIRLPGIFGGSKKSGFLYHTIKKLNQNEPLFIETTNLKYWEPLYIEDLVKMFGDFLKKYTFSSSLNVFNFSYGEKIDLVKTAYKIKKTLKSTSNIDVGKRDYRPFFLSNQRLKKIISLNTYSFKIALNKYIEELL